MKTLDPAYWTRLDTDSTIWNKFYTVAPLTVIGSKEEEERYDLAPKHMVTPLGHDNYFGFVCTPSHMTYQNVLREEEFTVSFVRPDQVVMASLAATPRCGESDYEKKILEFLPTVKARTVDALFVKDAYLYFECRLARVVDGFGKFSLLAGKIIEAHVHNDAMRISDIDEAEAIRRMPLLAYLPYGRFAEIKETLSFPYPRDFIQTDLVEPH